MADQNTDSYVENDVTAAIGRLASFNGPPEAFLPELLSLQCRAVGTRRGALLRLVGEGRRVSPQKSGVGLSDLTRRGLAS